MKPLQAMTKRWYLLVIPLFLLLVALPGVQIYPYYQPALSAATIAVVGQTAVVKFNLAEADRENFLAAARKIGFSWDGRDIAVSLGTEAAKELARYTPLNIGILARSSSHVTLQADIKNLPKTSPELVGKGSEFIPSDALVTLRAEGLARNYNLPGREVFDSTEPVGTLGVLASGDKIEFIYVTEITNLSQLEATLASLKDQAVTPGEGYTQVEGVAAGFSESNFEAVTTYTLSQPGLMFQPTFGIVGHKLLVASSASVWQLAKKASETGESIAANPRYGAARGNMPIFSVGSGYLDLARLSQGLSSWIALLSPFAKVNLGAADVAKVSFGHLQTAIFGWFGLDSLGPSSRVLLHLSLDD